MGATVLFLVSAVLCVLCVSTSASGATDPCSVLGLHSSYDAIVVGSGPGGSVAARRLAEYAGGKLNVLQVERGAYYSECPLCAIPGDELDISYVPVTGNSFNFVAQSHIVGDPVYNVKDTAIQGGGSSINGMIWIKADGPHFYDTFWPSNWNWNTMYPYYTKVENYTYPSGFYGPENKFNYTANLRGNNGLIKVTQTDTSFGNGFSGDFINAAVKVWPLVPAARNSSLNNGYFPGIGVAPPEHSYYNGVRSSGYPSYISTYTGSNLRAIARVRVNKILFEGTVVTGVELVFLNFSGLANSSTCVVSTNTVISSSGTFGTPKLLKLSGIGPAQELTNLGIKVVVDSPLVGTHLVDQFGIDIFTTGSKVPGPDYGGYGVLFYNVEDIPLLPPNFGINLDVYSEGSTSYGAFDTDLVYAESTGTVTLASANPDDEPVVNPNYLSSVKDRIVLGIAVNQTRQVAINMGLQFSPDPCATADCSTPNNQLNAYLSQGAGQPGFHWSGTASIGRVLNPLTAGVWGTTGLYVLDASAFPLSPGENTQFTTYAYSERAIELVIADHQTRDQWNFS